MLPPLPAARRNAILAASVPDSDNRYEPGAVLCIPEFILGERCVDDVKSYKITWLNLDDSYCTWKLAATFDSNPHIHNSLKIGLNTKHNIRMWYVTSKATKSRQKKPNLTQPHQHPYPQNRHPSIAGSPILGLRAHSFWPIVLCLWAYVLFEPRFHN